MRITNKIMQRNNLSNINTNKVYQDKLSTQMSTQKKVSRPSDDPVVSIRALRLRSNVTEVTQYYSKNIPDAESWLDVTEDALKNLTEIITNMIKQCTKASNGDLKSADRQIILEQLKANFTGECGEVGMYLCMARIAHREGYPEVGLYWEKAGLEEAEHAAKFAELLGEVVTDSTEKNLQMRVDAENGATAGKFELAKLAKKYNLDAIHDTVHEMARDEARHGKAFEGLLKRYFG